MSGVLTPDFRALCKARFGASSNFARNGTGTFRAPWRPNEPLRGTWRHVQSVSVSSGSSSLSYDVTDKTIDINQSALGRSVHAEAGGALEVHTQSGVGDARKVKSALATMTSAAQVGTRTVTVDFDDGGIQVADNGVSIYDRLPIPVAPAFIVQAGSAPAAALTVGDGATRAGIRSGGAYSCAAVGGSYVQCRGSAGSADLRMTNTAMQFYDRGSREFGYTNMRSGNTEILWVGTDKGQAIRIPSARKMRCQGLWTDVHFDGERKTLEVERANAPGALAGMYRGKTRTFTLSTPKLTGTVRANDTTISAVQRVSVGANGEKIVASSQVRSDGGIRVMMKPADTPTSSLAAAYYPATDDYRLYSHDGWSVSINVTTGHVTVKQYDVVVFDAA